MKENTVVVGASYFMPRVYKKIDLVGQKFGRLTVLSFSHTAKRCRTFWKVRCDCGNEFITRGDGLKNGKTASCGCFRLITTHGLSKLPEYRAWIDMRARCFNPSDKNKKLHYTDRGITVCDGFNKSVELFINIIGKKPTKKHSVDRINNDAHYSCGKCAQCVENKWNMNVRWATPKIQGGNQRKNVWIEYNGERMILADWAFRFNVQPTRLRYYLSKFPMEIAIKLSKTIARNGSPLWKRL